MSLEQTFAAVQQDEENKALRVENARLRQVISCAVCAACFEEIADQPWLVNDAEELVHKDCAEALA